MSDENKRVDWSTAVASGLKKKIEVLEKKTEWNGQQIVKAFDSLIELREIQKKGWKDYQFLQGSQIKRQDYLQEQLIELIEDSKICKLGRGDTVDQIINIKEVLREFIDLEYHHYIMGQLFGDAHKFEKLLEKLDSGGEKDREIIIKKDQKSLVSPYYACGEPKDHKNNSKLSEPIGISSFILPREDDLSDWLRQARSHGLILVKREDLQWLFEWTEFGMGESPSPTQWHRNELKRIKEVYGI